MQRRTLIATVGAVIGTGIGATAYTSATVDRSATIDVVSDDTGLIGLGLGTSGDLIYYNNDALAIDLTQGTASGANVDSTFTFGDEADAANSYAFTVTNNDTVTRGITLQYTDVTDPDTGNLNVQFKLYDSNGGMLEDDGATNPSITSVVDESGSSYTISAAPNTAYHVVLVIDTTGLDSTADLSGTLNVTA